MTTLIAVLLVLAGLVLSRLRVARELNSKRFMPAVYAVVTVYFAVRAYYAVANHARVWPNVLLALLFLSGVVSSARASGVFKKS